MEPQSESRRPSLGRSFIAGCLAGLPIAILLSYLAVLPLFLGLFFFLLLGLLVGALMFRFGRDAAPAPRRVLWLAGTGVVLLMWLTTLVVEYVLFPALATQRVAKSWPRRLTPEEKQILAAAVRREALSRFVGREYRGGPVDWVRGFAGYVSWISGDGRMQCPRGRGTSSYLLELKQRRRAWVFRVLVSLGLLEFAVMSLLLGLAKEQRREAGGDGVPPHSLGPGSACGSGL